VVHAATKLPQGLVAGALLVAPADVDAADRWPADATGERLDTRAAGFAPMPISPLPFPALVLASANDPFCDINRARHLADAWSAAFTDAGEVGHINTASGHGPWPEGLLRFGSFLKSLD
jgi:predicted alpha/beta hydrolase family esterase